MYALVNDIESYPQFLPWCSEAKVIQPGVEELSASLTMQTGRLNYSFTTRNNMVPNRSIHVTLLEGPFKQLIGSWLFEDKPNATCLITLDMTFEYKNRLIKLALSGVFNKIVNTLVESFTQRARDLYG